MSNFNNTILIPFIEELIDVSLLKLTNPSILFIENKAKITSTTRSNITRIINIL